MKKWILMLIFVLIASVLVPHQSQVNASTNLNDISANHRAYKEIMYLVDRSIVNGYDDGSFKPLKQVTRGEAAAMLGRALKLDGTKKGTHFSDVGSNNMASGYIVALVNKGIISGYSDGTFRPNNVLNRGEMAILLNRAFNFGGQNATTAAAALMQKGIAQGYPDGSFGAQEKIVRADFSIFLARSLNESFRIKSDEVSFSTTMYVNTGSDTLNLRKGPGTSYASISSLKSGTAVAVASSASGWSHIKVNGVIGYVSTSYLSTSKPSVSPNPIPVVKSNLTVIIDPGHGGKDPGATGNGFLEKNVVLNIGKHMQDYIEKTPINVKMTRETDKFVELADRAKFASRNDGDVFVSIHTNALNGSANGQETFYYASTAAVNPNVKSSRALSIYLQARMQEVWDLKNRGVKAGNYQVLRQNTVPAALVEIGFIDSTTDIQYIKDEADRKAMGKALFLGTLDYFYHYEGRTDVLPYYKTVGAAPSYKRH
ncbi:N-acetylmuramoyl-L-alanine amidase [Planococcus sp. N064]|uniref:N-acetylmuramoyl-L-alanine amidase n=1 Tax=Planococcus liqunii TaxID=3058394 RepID=A0ABT8MNW7_9BACL|nr:N-acetylmuramoyl-L-alanine amidase [Planococcus sp. N064]MDN7226481.1 N-acetylmuramoyl-L-alanine amidase [Planococcus sp. N064]